MKPASFEEVLEQVGSNGRYQYLLVWLFVLPLNFVIPWMVLAPIFFTSTPSHHCAPPPITPALEAQQPHGELYPSDVLTHPPSQHHNMTMEMWKAVAIPRTDGELDQCHQYNVTWEDISEFSQRDDNITQWLQETYGVIGCAHGMWYDDTEFSETLPSNLGWVCNSDPLTAMWLSVGLAGNVVGTLAFTSLADMYGRRPLLAVTALVFAVFGSLRVYMTSTWTVMLSQFVASMPFPAILELSLIIAMEQVSSSWRSTITSASFVLWTMGMCTLPLMAWLIRSWRILCLATSLPFAIFSAAYWLLPESPSWLLSRGRVVETTKLMKNIAERNGRTVPSDLQDQLSLLGGGNKVHYGPLQLFQSPTVRKRTIQLTICYTCNNLFYYGLTYNIDNMSGNQFLNFFLFGITELPANILGCWMADGLGRRWSQVLSFVFAIVFTLAALPLVGTSPWVATGLLITSKLFVTISFLVIYIQLAEIYPTSHRGSGTGLSSLISSCFGIMAPYIAYLSNYSIWYPYMILAVIGIVGLIVASLLPETRGEDLPQTLDDAEGYLLNETFLSYKGKLPCKSKTNNTESKSSPRLRQAPVTRQTCTEGVALTGT